VKWLLLGAVTAGVGAALAIGLDPSGAAAVPFNSDGAIPVLMANHRPWDLFHLYFYGMDRFGAWPFAAEALAGRALGFAWTPSSLHVDAGRVQLPQGSTPEGVPALQNQSWCMARVAATCSVRRESSSPG